MATTTRERSAPDDSESQQTRRRRGPAQDRDRGETRSAKRPVEARPGGAATWVARATRGLARLVRLAALVIAAIIGVGILFVVLDANQSNDVVSTIHDWARALVGPFDGMFNLDDAKAEVAVNWGIAAFVYLILGVLVAGLIARIGAIGLVSRRRVAAS